MHFRNSFARGAALVLGLTVGLGTAAGCGRYSINNLRSVKAFKDGSDAYKKSDFATAAAKFEESIARNDSEAIVFFFLANSYDQQWKPSRKGEPANDAFMEKAVQNYQKCIDKIAAKEVKTADDTKYMQYSYEYLIAAYGPEKLNDFSKAEPIAKKLIEIKPNEPINYQALGGMYRDQGRYDEAEAMYKKAAEVKPDDPQVYTALANYYNTQGNFDATMAALEARTKYEPNNPEAYHYMATFFQDKIAKDFRLSKSEQRAYALRGIAAEDKAIALNPNYAEAMIYKNILLRQQANAEKDPALQKALIAQADDLRAKGIAIQKKANSGK
jgi:tetratricopeptide (TPR) repeat protein